MEKDNLIKKWLTGELTEAEREAFEKLDDYKEHGYIYIIPHVALKVNGNEMSGTSIRRALGDKSIKAPEKRKLFKGIFGHSDKSIYKLVVDKLTRLSEEKMETRGLLLDIDIPHTPRDTVSVFISVFGKDKKIQIE